MRCRMVGRPCGQFWKKKLKNKKHLQTNHSSEYCAYMTLYAHVKLNTAVNTVHMIQTKHSSENCAHDIVRMIQTKHSCEYSAYDTVHDSN